MLADGLEPVHTVLKEIALKPTRNYTWRIETLLFLTQYFGKVSFRIPIQYNAFGVSAKH